jgi:hypothetical protein
MNANHGDDLDRNNLGDGTYLPRLLTGNIAHYYGDYVRRIFLGIALILLLSIPFVADTAFVLLPIQIIGAIILILLSALTNPKNKIIMIADVAASVLGIIALELFALAAYRGGAVMAMIGFQTLAVAFMYALYLSLKTLRAMELHQIGVRDLPGEFMQQKHEEARAEESR